MVDKPGENLEEGIEGVKNLTDATAKLTKATQDAVDAVKSLTEATKKQLRASGKNAEAEETEYQNLTKLISKEFEQRKNREAASENMSRALSERAQETQKITTLTGLQTTAQQKLQDVMEAKKIKAKEISNIEETLNTFALSGAQVEREKERLNLLKASLASLENDEAVQNRILSNINDQIDQSKKLIGQADERLSVSQEFLRADEQSILNAARLREEIDGMKPRGLLGSIPVVGTSIANLKNTFRNMSNAVKSDTGRLASDVGRDLGGRLGKAFGGRFGEFFGKRVGEGVAKIGQALGGAKGPAKAFNILVNTARFFGNVMKQTSAEGAASFEKVKGAAVDVAIGILTGTAPLVAAYHILVSSVDRWIELDKEAGAFRTTTGLILSQTEKIDRATREINVQNSEMGISLKKTYLAAEKLYNAFGTTALVTKEMIKSTSMLAANLGMAEEDVAKFRGTFTSLAKSSGTTAENVIHASAALANMAGIAPAAVMKDLASASEDTLKFLSKSPMQMMRTAVEARRLGTTLNDLSRSAKGMLNFQDSLTAEMEASALVGRNVNFQLSRQLAFEGDILGSRKAAMDQIKRAGDFSKMNVYQQEALAKAAGMTVDEVVKQQNQQKMLEALKNSANAEDRKAYADYENMTKKLQENEKDTAETLVKKGREMARQQMMQAEMNKLGNAFHSIWTSIADALVPISNLIMPILVGLARGLARTFKVIGAIVRGLLYPFDVFLDFFRNSSEGGLALEKVFTTLEEITNDIVDVIGALATIIWSPVKAVMDIAKWAGVSELVFNNIANIMKLIVSPVTALAKIFRNISEVFGDESLSWGDKFGKMFDAIGRGLYDAFTQPLVDILDGYDNFFGGLWDKIKDGFTSAIKQLPDAWMNAIDDMLKSFENSGLPGESPSRIGLMIVRGIKAIGSLLIDALTLPFRTVVNFVGSLFGIDKLGNAIVGGLKLLGGIIFDVLTYPFRTVFDFISDLFSGESIATAFGNFASSALNAFLTPFKTLSTGLKTIFLAAFKSLLGSFRGISSLIKNVFSLAFGSIGDNFTSVGKFIIDTIKNVMTMVGDFIMAPFKMMWELIKKIPGAGNLFGDKNVATDVANTAVSQSVEIINVQEIQSLTESVRELAGAINELNGFVTEAASPIVNVNGGIGGGQIVEKLDELISLLQGGAIAVNIDGRKVSTALASSARD